MSQVIAIDNDIKNPSTFEVTWDVGLRCNFDCTYCPPHRHNNTSPHASLETLIKTSKFVFDYKIYQKFSNFYYLAYQKFSNWFKYYKRHLFKYK